MKKELFQQVQPVSWVPTPVRLLICMFRCFLIFFSLRHDLFTSLSGGWSVSFTPFLGPYPTQDTPPSFSSDNSGESNLQCLHYFYTANTIQGRGIEPTLPTFSFQHSFWVVFPRVNNDHFYACLLSTNLTLIPLHTWPVI